MQSTNKSGKTGKKSKGAKAAVAILFFYVLLITGGLGIARFHAVSLPPAVRDAIQSHTSALGLAAALGVAGIFGFSIFPRRKPVRNATPSFVRSRPMMFEKPTEPTHPLYTTQRTVRDQSFVFRKTKKKGHLNRNRAGEKVPHTD